MATIDTQLAELLGKNAELFAVYEAWSNANVMLLAGTIDDPGSFNSEGGKTGALGYYPVVNVSGQTIYVPSLARLQATALGSADPAALETLLTAKVAESNAAADRAQVAASELQPFVGNFRIFAGPTGFAFLDDLGQEVMFVPFDAARALLMPFLSATRDAASLGPLAAQRSGGVDGFAVTDRLGQEVAFVPFTAGRATTLPNLLATSSLVSAGPLSARAVPGVDGIVFVDALGQGIKVGESSASAPSLDKGEVQSIAAGPFSVITGGHSKGELNSWGGSSNPGNSNGNTARRLDQGWLAWADYYLRGSIDWISNAAVGGENDLQILARVATDIIAKKPALCIMIGGTCNSIAAGYTADQIIATQIGSETPDSGSSILGLLQDAGIKTLWMTDPTWATGHPQFTAANFAALSRVNRALLRAQGYKAGLVTLDANALIIDPASATGAAKATFLKPDNIHQSPKGDRAIGKALASRLQAIGYPVRDILIASAADNSAYNASSKQLLPNPMMIGTAGTFPSSVTGQVPTGYRIAVSGTWPAASITSALVPRADGYGNDWVVTVANAPAADAAVILIGPDLRPQLAPGDVVEAAAQIDLVGMSKVKGHEFTSSLSNGSQFLAISTFERDATTNLPSDYYDQADLTGGVMRTGKAAVPTGTLANGSGDLRFRVTFDAAGGSATIRMSRAQFLKGA